MKILKLFICATFVVVFFACSSESADVVLKNTAPGKENVNSSTAKLNAGDLASAKNAWSAMISSTNTRTTILPYRALQQK